MTRRTATPHLVKSTPATAVSLPRRDLRTTNASGYDERWVQDLVHRCPSILPISDVEAAFWPATPVCRELPLASGYLDNLLVTPLGDLIAVECKLWRNVEARREVIAQVIDYAKDLQALTFEGLQSAVRKARKEPQFSLFAHATASTDTHELDEARFIDAVSRNLRRGRCLLVILGDGITENVESLSEFLQQHAGLHFALVLVQLAVHELPGTSDLIVIPSLPLRTTNIVRGIVQTEEVNIVIRPPAQTVRAEKPTTLTEDELFAALDAKVPGTSDRLVEFVTACEDLQVSYEVKKQILIRMTSETRTVTVFAIDATGRVDMTYAYGVNDLVRSFVHKVVEAIPGTVVKETAKSCFAKKADGSYFNIWELLDNAVDVRIALEELNRTLHAVDDQR